MTLTQLEAFVAAVAAGTFTAAATRLGMTQPSISDLIRRMETELGAKLFDRSGRSLMLTAAGEQLVPYAEQAVRSAADGARAVAAVLELGGGTATFGLLRNADFYLASDLASGFHLKHPKVKMRLVGQNSSETARDVANGELEAGLVTLPVDDDTLETVPIARDEVVFVSREADRTAGPRTIEELVSSPLVLYDAHYAKSDPTRRQLTERAQLAGVQLDAEIEVEYLASALALVSKGFGDTIACRASLATHVLPLGLHHASFAEPMYDTLALIKRRRQILSPATRELARLAYVALLDQGRSAGGTVEVLDTHGRAEQFLR